jgi:hypothetical protein
MSSVGFNNVNAIILVAAFRLKAVLVTENPLEIVGRKRSRLKTKSSTLAEK